MNTIKSIITAFLILISPIYGILLSVYFLILLDLVTGTARSLYASEKFSFSKLKNSAVKFILYEFSIIAFFLIDHAVFNEIFLQFIDLQYIATKVITIVIILVEGKSIISNVEQTLKINIWDTINNAIDKFKAIVLKIKNVFKSKSDSE